MVPYLTRSLKRLGEFIQLKHLEQCQLLDLVNIFITVVALEEKQAFGRYGRV